METEHDAWKDTLPLGLIAILITEATFCQLSPRHDVYQHVNKFNIKYKTVALILSGSKPKPKIILF